MPYMGPDALREPRSAALAYSAVADGAAGGSRESRTDRGSRLSRMPVLAIAAVLTVFVGGAVALALALAFDIRAHVEQRPQIGKNVVAPATPEPAKPALPAPPPPAAVPAPPAPAAPQQDPSGRPRDHDLDDWLRRHLPHGMPGP
jgi:cell division protein FtsN